MSRAEIDYIGPFVKAWAAFNTWYRDASGQTQERGMLQYVKDQPNPVRGRTLSLLGNGNETAEALNLKQAVYDLHKSLDATHVEVVRKGVNERISLRTVCIRPKHLQQEQLERRGQEFKAVRVPAAKSRSPVSLCGPSGCGSSTSLRDGQPSGVENLPGFDRMMHFPDDDFRAGLLRRKRPSGKRPEGQKIPLPRLKPNLPNGQGNRDQRAYLNRMLRLALPFFRRRNIPRENASSNARYPGLVGYAISCSSCAVDMDQ